MHPDGDSGPKPAFGQDLVAQVKIAVVIGVIWVWLRAIWVAVVSFLVVQSHIAKDTRHARSDLKPQGASGDGPESRQVKRQKAVRLLLARGHVDQASLSGQVQAWGDLCLRCGGRKQAEHAKKADSKGLGKWAFQRRFLSSATAL